MNKDMVKLSDDSLDAVTGGTVYHYVFKQGDDLEKLAQDYNVKLDDLKKWNKIGKNGVVPVGTTLTIYY